jgi:hypothetical protein
MEHFNLICESAAISSFFSCLGVPMQMIEEAPPSIGKAEGGYLQKKSGYTLVQPDQKWMSNSCYGLRLALSN